MGSHSSLGHAILILGLNIRLVGVQLAEWFSNAGSYKLWLLVILVPILSGMALLLFWMAFEPILPRSWRALGRGKVELPERKPTTWTAPKYRNILLPLDHSDRDGDAIAHAAALAKAHGSTLHLLHIEEGVTSQVYGSMSSTAEVNSGEDYLAGIVETLRVQGIDAGLRIIHSQNPRAEIVRVARELRPDLIVMGAHGHKGIKDIFLGTTINAVRHELDIPILVVRK